jgi:cathepsin A (carboxypeptidase C)
MKVAASALLVSAASAAIAPQQQVLKFPSSFSELKEEAWTKPLHNLEESLKSLTGEARATWDEVAMMYPESFDKAAFFSTPKPHTRKHDSEWDHIVKGADVQSVWVENAQGEKEREIDGKLEQFDLRVKKVDPSVLGVDKVKQYSGYLDDNEEDKHLFYCEYPSKQMNATAANNVQGSLSRATTPRTTPWCFGSMADPAARR